MQGKNNCVCVKLLVSILSLHPSVSPLFFSTVVCSTCYDENLSRALVVRAVKVDSFESCSIAVPRWPGRCTFRSNGAAPCSENPHNVTGQLFSTVSNKFGECWCVAEARRLSVRETVGSCPRDVSVTSLPLESNFPSVSAVV